MDKLTVERKKKVDELLWRLIHLNALARSFHNSFTDQQRYKRAQAETEIELSMLGYQGWTP